MFNYMRSVSHITKKLIRSAPILGVLHHLVTTAADEAALTHSAHTWEPAVKAGAPF